MAAAWARPIFRPARADPKCRSAERFTVSPSVAGFLHHFGRIAS